MVTLSFLGILLLTVIEFLVVCRAQCACMQQARQLLLISIDEMIIYSRYERHWLFVAAIVARAHRGEKL